MLKALTLLTLAVGSTYGQTTRPNCGGRNERPPSAEIEIVSYNDVYEMQQVDVGTGISVGGPSRVVPLVNRLRKNYENSLVIFAGDTMSPSLWSTEFKGMQMIEAHNALQVDFACLGNHEFDFGIEGFLNVSTKSNFPWLNANAYEISTGKLLRNTQPNIVKKFASPTMGEITVGAFGVMYDMKDPSKGMRWTDPIVAAKEQVKILRQEKKVDFVIALTHQDWLDDNRMSQEVAGLDLIYGGHDHTAMMQTTFGAPYLKSDLDFRSIWFSHIKYYAPLNTTVNGTTTTKKAFTKMQHRNVQITQGLKSDAALDAIIDSYSARIKELQKRIVGSFCAETDLRNIAVRAKETPIGNFFADSMLNYYEGFPAEIGIMNGGGIRTDKMWPAGNLTIGDVISWSPFGNVLFVIETDGASLKKFFNYKMGDTCGDKMVSLNGLYFHVAGIKYEFKCTGAGKGALSSLTWNTKNRSGEVADSDTFRIALPDFMYTTVFKPSGGVAKVLVNDKEADRTEKVLEKFLSNIPNRSMCYTTEGRSAIVFA